MCRRCLPSLPTLLVTTRPPQQSGPALSCRAYQQSVASCAFSRRMLNPQAPPSGRRSHSSQAQPAAHTLGRCHLRCLASVAAIRALPCHRCSRSAVCSLPRTRTTSCQLTHSSRQHIHHLSPPSVGSPRCFPGHTHIVAIPHSKSHRAGPALLTSPRRASPVRGCPTLSQGAHATTLRPPPHTPTALARIISHILAAGNKDTVALTVCPDRCSALHPHHRAHHPSWGPSRANSSCHASSSARASSARSPGQTQIHMSFAARRRSWLLP